MSDDLDVARRVIAIEAAALGALASSLDQSFVDAVAAVAAMKGRLICAGVGKSGHVARKIAATLASTGTPAQFIHPTEASHGDMGMIGAEDVVLALSKSGEVSELSDLLAYSRRFSIPLIAITANAGSMLGKAADHVLLLPDAPEACAETRAPTTSTTLQIALGDALAVALIERRGFTAQDFRVYHPGGKLGAMLKTVGDLMHSGERLPQVSPATPIRDVLLVMSEHLLGCTAVVDGKTLVGIITDGDVRRKAGVSLEAATAGDLMSTNPMTCPPDMLAAEALGLLNDTKRTVLLVADQPGHLVGIIHLHDLLRAGVA
ncbi:MAG: KpsF/GutQ family sugar-phosphate isomerase [Hyphomonadaceae bacterium]|jgi:arabinose-5-phosphate isomerase|nr:KpsF/GutQ family sugar-phosphate isomerase [Hyphomonadaceae bacterium]